jgi:hypothetical protein
MIVFFYTYNYLKLELEAIGANESLRKIFLYSYPHGWIFV